MQGPVHARSVRVWIFLGVLFLVSQDALEVMFVTHWLTDWLFALTLLMWPLWARIPSEDLNTDGDHDNHGDHDDHNDDLDYDDHDDHDDYDDPDDHNDYDDHDDHDDHD